MVPTAWRALIDHILTVDKHLIPFTGADRCNYNFIISGKLKGGIYQFRPDCAAFLGFTRIPFAGNCLPVIWCPLSFCLCHIHAKPVNHLGLNPNFVNPR